MEDEREEDVDYNSPEFTKIWALATTIVASKMGEIYCKSSIDVLACGYILGMHALLFNSRDAEEPYTPALERYIERISSATETFISGIKSSSPDYPFIRYMSPEKIEEITREVATPHVVTHRKEGKVWEQYRIP